MQEHHVKKAFEARPVVKLGSPSEKKFFFSQQNSAAAYGLFQSHNFISERNVLQR
jgi:hypothetical protein